MIKKLLSSLLCLAILLSPVIGYARAIGQNVVYRVTVIGLTISAVDGGATASGGAFIDNLPATTFATGGIITVDGLYTVHKFTSTGNSLFITPKSITVEYLIVGGGGGGGGGIGGGGGAGGYKAGTLAITAGNKNVTVGLGGTAGTGNVTGGNGGDSVFDSITSTGGGGGGRGQGGVSQDGVIGGSGGGGGGAYAVNRLGGHTIGGSQGNDGGGSITTGNVSAGAGGGGGASGVGTDGDVSRKAGSGGNGLANDIIQTGVDVVYAGGGGGGVYYPGVAGTGGTGGGGDGTLNNTTAEDGTDNLGGGGGGGGYQTASALGGKGGTGVVIIRYLTSDLTPAATYADGTHEIQIFDSAGRMLKGILKAVGTGETLGTEIATGTCVANTLYKITATEANHYGTGLVVGSYFTSIGTETNDANNKVKQVLTPSNLGATIVSVKGGVTYNFSYKNASFAYNEASYKVQIVKKRGP